MLLQAGAARAQACTTDADCPDRFSCEVVGQTGCATKACPEGQKCPEPEACEPSDIKQCRSPACTKDADCPKDMVCFAQTSTECMTTPSCKPNEPCDASAPPDCKDVTTRSCVPRYVPPCTAASDCGDGFACVEGMQCGCSGGGATSRDGGMTTAQDASCTCAPTGESNCELQRMTCRRAAECPDGWSCEDDPNRAACHSAGGSGASSGSAGAATASADAGSVTGCDDAGTEKVCLPPYYAFARGGLGKGDGTSEQGTNGGAPHASDAGSPGTNTHTSAKHDSGGCTVSASRAPSQIWPLALALVVVARRKRARRA